MYFVSKYVTYRHITGTFNYMGLWMFTKRSFICTYYTKLTAKIWHIVKNGNFAMWIWARQVVDIAKVWNQADYERRCSAFLNWLPLEVATAMFAGHWAHSEKRRARVHVAFSFVWTRQMGMHKASPKGGDVGGECRRPDVSAITYIGPAALPQRKKTYW